MKLPRRKQIRSETQGDAILLIKRQVRLRICNNSTLRLAETSIPAIILMDKSLFIGDINAGESNPKQLQTQSNTPEQTDQDPASRLKMNSAEVIKVIKLCYYREYLKVSRFHKYGKRGNISEFSMSHIILFITIIHLLFDP